MPCDLHVHTTASDGTESPQEVVEKAKRLGLSALAITDHDTVKGIAPALEAGCRFGIAVLPGVELAAEEGEREVHILGYLFDPHHPALARELARFEKARLERVEKMVKKLRAMGVPLELERVLELAGGGTVGRPHVARALVELGAVGSVAEAFARYLDRHRPAYVPRLKFAPEEAVLLIRRAGGVAVLAHPGLSQCRDIIPRLVSAGLRGLEVYHPEHPPDLVDYYREFCRRYGLVATGGSDYHGTDHRKYNRLGETTAPDEVVEKLIELAGSAN